MEQEINQIILNNNTIVDPNISVKVEKALQTLNNITIPSIILEYTSPDNLDFELVDLKQFYDHFGEVLNIVINGKQSIVLFKTFFSANICKIFLENKGNYRENMDNNFKVRWFDYNKDYNILPLEARTIFQQINDKNTKQNILDNNAMNNINANNIDINLNMQMNNLNINENINPITQNQNILNQNLQYLQNNLSIPVNNFPPPGIGIIPNYNIINQLQNQQQNIINPINMLISQNMPNLNNLNNYNNIGVLNNVNNMNNLNISNINNINNLNSMNNINNLNSINNINNLNSMNNINNINNMNILNVNNIGNINNFNNIINSQNNQRINNNQYNNNEEKNSGKFTCKYEILIENDSEFQIARRLIGSKGCNMKKIINECKSTGDKEGVKLRLRGKGSGYKEGPQNKESDEPLHLCISAKNAEEMKTACILVDELLERIHKDYKEFCEKNNIIPASTEIAKRIENKNIIYKGK